MKEEAWGKLPFLLHENAIGDAIYAEKLAYSMHLAIKKNGEWAVATSVVTECHLDQTLS